MPQPTRMLVGLAGLKHAGKDAAADCLVRHHGFVKHALAAPLKRACKDVFALSDDQVDGPRKDLVDPRYDVTPRLIMQRFGTDCVRQLAPDAWVHKFREWHAACEHPRVVVSDVRFQNEVDAIRELGGRVFLVDRGGDREPGEHPSERADELDRLDGVVRNAGTLGDLHAAVCRAVLG
jgi:hypothetical protein